jgi:intracellular multiplication protein IcmC
LAVNSALTFVQVIGVIAFVRGWLILKKVVEGSGNVSLAQGLTHILGGVLAINIFQFLLIMDHTFGLNLLD